MYCLGLLSQGRDDVSEAVVIALLKDLQLGSAAHTSLYALLVICLGELMQLGSGRAASPHGRLPLLEFGALSLSAHPDVSATWGSSLWP